MSKFMDQNGVEHFTQTLINSTKTINNTSIWGTGNIDLNYTKSIIIAGYPWLSGNSMVINSLQSWFNNANEFGGNYTNNFHAFYTLCENISITFLCSYSTDDNMVSTTYITPYEIKTIEKSTIQLLSIYCIVRGSKYDFDTGTVGDKYEGMATITVSAENNVVNLVDYAFVETIDPNKWNELSVTLDRNVNGTGLDTSYITLTSENTHIHFNCRFGNVCPASPDAFQIKVPKSNNLNHYRIYLSASIPYFSVTPGWSYGCAAGGNFIQIVGDTSSSGSDTYGVIFSFANDSTSYTTKTQIRNDTSFFKFNWNKPSNDYAGIEIDLFKHVIGSTNLIYYSGLVKPINAYLSYSTNDLYPSA